MAQAIRMHKTGGPEVLAWEEVDPGQPEPGEVLVAHDAVGLNFIDIYHRTGLYPLPSFPVIPGLEAAGLVEQVGEGVSGFSKGDRVAYAGVPLGAYTEARCMPADRLVKLPEAISTKVAAAMLLQGMTVRYLLKGCYHVGPGSAILVHAAAGGVGTIMCQWASSLGATVIGTAGSREKVDLALKNGCAHGIDYRDEDFVAKVAELTGGKGVDVVYDSVGQATFMESLDCLRPMGYLVSFGQSSGPVGPFDPSILAAKGSLFLTRPSLMSYTASHEDLQEHAKDLFDVLESGAVQLSPIQEYRLEDAARAQQDLEGRKTRGSVILLP
jgi:NADPH2:quinone reductase